jgi:tetratricopeptide (TPR) repeat protein
MRRLASRIAAAFTVLLLAAGCATPEAHRPLERELRPDGGFTVHERVRVSPRVRADFEHGVALLDAGRFDEGIAVLERVTEAAPNLVAARIDLGIAHARIGELDLAEAELEHALTLAPSHPVAQNELAIVYRRTGRFREARAHYESALATYPAFHLARKNLAILCDLYLMDPDCALEHYHHYLQAVPEDATTAMWMRDLRTRHGKE